MVILVQGQEVKENMQDTVLKFHLQAGAPTWSSGQDPAFSPPGPGFDSRCGNVKFRFCV